MNMSVKSQTGVMASHSSFVTPKKLLIILPAFNEEGNIRRTIEEIFALNLDCTVCVVNDGSSDATASEACLTPARVISLPFNLGIGGAVQTGFRLAEKEGFEFAIQVDGDGQHDPRYIKTILEPVMQGKVDMSIGSRFLPPYLGYQSSFVRRIGIHFFAYLISVLTDCKVTDPTSGFRCFNRKLIRLFASYYPQDFPEPEAIVVARRYNAKIVEVPVEMRKRSSGNSSIRYLKTLQYMIKVTLAILLDRLKQKKEL
jgi:glycosyltransferase involved in cell wall biosynthesis